MPFNLTYFRDLCAKYPTWSDLRPALLAAGLLVVAEDTMPGRVIVRYDKTKAVGPELRWWRSVVWNTETNRPVCIAPPKTSAEPLPTGMEGLVAQEYLDGFMINAWTEGAEVALATRSCIGATGTFYSKKSFAALFKEIIGAAGVPLAGLVGAGADAASGFASFHCQHPEHRVVTPVAQMGAWRIYRGEVAADGSVVIEEDIAGPLAVPAAVATPSPPPWQSQGVIYRDGAGGRWRVRNPAYQMVRSLRGNDLRADIRFVRLWQQKLLDTYLCYYPEEAATYQALIKRLDYIVGVLYTMYVGVHIKKIMKLDGIDPMWRPHVYALHGHYMSTLKPAGVFVRRKDVAEYLERLPWQRLVFMLTRA